MRISDWSSDVCSSDLLHARKRRRRSPASASPTCASCKAAGTASQLRLGGLALGAPLDGGLDLRLAATEGLDQLPLVDHRHVQHLDQHTVAGPRQYLGADVQAPTTDRKSDASEPRVSERVDLRGRRT